MFVRSYVSLLSILLVVLMYRGAAFGASISAARAAFDPQKGPLLAPLLKPRVAGTLGSERARQHIMTQLQRANWTVETHNFTASTPIGPVPMHNILASPAHGNATDVSAQARNNATQKLTLAAHYDSKRTPEGFIGATDSAFPCALLLYLAGITKQRKIDFDLIFFDGEEAFENWTDDDSIYGAKALAEYQESTNTLPETLVLLDLLGNEARFPISSWFPQTKSLHQQLENINPRLVGGRDLHEFAGMVQDDHLPFLSRGVPVLHLIPHTFPDIWHTMEDDGSALDPDTMEAWADLFETWLFEGN